MGFAASVPYPPTLPVASPVSLKDHTCFSVDTFASVIVDPTASRLFARLPFEYGHDPTGGKRRAAPAVWTPIGTPTRPSASVNAMIRVTPVVNFASISRSSLRRPSPRDTILAVL